MKLLLHYSFVFILLLAAGQFSCNKAGQAEVFEATLVDAFCAFNIVAIEDPAFYKLGMKWKNAQGNTLEHVFSVGNPCDFNKEQLRKGDRFRCKIIETPRDTTCAVCLGYMETPPLTYHIEVIR